MENSWIEEFYKETDADKRLELLENNSTDMDGDSAGSSTVFRQRLWTARYGKRKPKNDAFVGCLMELMREQPTITVKKIADQISSIAFDAPHMLHMDKEFAILQSAALAAFRQEYPNREHFLRK